MAHHVGFLFLTPDYARDDSMNESAIAIVVWRVVRLAVGFNWSISQVQDLKSLSPTACDQRLMDR